MISLRLTSSMSMSSSLQMNCRRARISLRAGFPNDITLHLERSGSMILEIVLHVRINRQREEYSSIMLRRIFCASAVKPSASSRCTILGTSDLNDTVEANALTFSRTVSIPRSSDALRYSLSAPSSFIMILASVVLPVPALDSKIRLGREKGFSLTTLRNPAITVVSLPM